MTETQTIEVPHLGGICVGYLLSNNNTYDPAKPTVVLMNSMCTTSALYKTQFSDHKLTESMNLLAIEPLGHGETRGKTEHFTYWDSAVMALQVMDKLGIERAFVLGTSQGGWIVMRMVLLAPERILGALILGTSMDYESSSSCTLGCWEPAPILTPFFQSWTSSTPTPDFEIDDVWCGMVGGLGFGAAVTNEMLDFWKKTLKGTYKGDDGRRRVRMAVVCLLERDGLLMRLGDVKCPVWWMQGTEDVVYGTRMSAEHIKLFTGSKDTKYTLVEGGAHYLNATNPKEINSALLEMVTKYK